VGFNIASHSTPQEHEASKTAVTLQNTKENDNNQIKFNQQSMVMVTPTFDIHFDYQPIRQSQKTVPSAQPAKKITLTDVLDFLFATHPTISQLSDSDTIEELLMDITDIKFTYNMNRKVITKISSSLITG